MAIDRRNLLTAAVPLLLAAAAGCGSEKKTSPVRGKFVWQDTNAPAKELAGGMVAFQCDAERITAKGPIGEDGSFVLGTYKLTDGAVVGRHKVVVGQPVADYGDNPTVEAVHKKYESVETTDLEVTVEARDNDITLTVAPGKWMLKKQKK